jgi:hypothetical protein
MTQKPKPRPPKPPAPPPPELHINCRWDVTAITFWWIVGISIQFATKGHSAVRMRIASVVLSVRFPFRLLRTIEGAMLSRSRCNSHSSEE